MFRDWCGQEQKMFERYTENASRVIFLAREEAMRYGSIHIESNPHLLGILRDNETLPTQIDSEMDS